METLADVLQRLGHVRGALQDLGIEPTQADQVSEFLATYQHLKDQLVQARKGQFRDEAYEFALENKVATNKVIDALAMSLRAFAEHVAEQTLTLHQQMPGASIEELVDYVVPMPEEEAQP
jgi:hypothetical protein